MKTENKNTTVENAASKQAWTEPTLTTLSLPLDTNAGAANGGDGMAASTNNT